MSAMASELCNRSRFAKRMSNMSKRWNLLDRLKGLMDEARADLAGIIESTTLEDASPAQRDRFRQQMKVDVDIPGQIGTALLAALKTKRSDGDFPSDGDEEHRPRKKTFQRWGLQEL